MKRLAGFHVDRLFPWRTLNAHGFLGPLWLTIEAQDYERWSGRIDWGFSHRNLHASITWRIGR